MNYPVLLFSDWAEIIMDNGGHYFLGGRSFDEMDTFGDELQTFWTRFQAVDPSFGFFRDSSPSDWRWTVPLALHGDEGRGKAKKPVMIVGFQTILPLQSGKGLSNMSGSHGHFCASHCFFEAHLLHSFAVHRVASSLYPEGLLRSSSGDGR